MAETREIAVLHVDGNPSFIQSSATTLGELLSEDEFQNMDTSNIKFVEGSNNTTLELESSSLPEGEFELFLSKKNTKAGVVDENTEYSKIRQEAKEIANSSQEGKNHMNSGGRNYTRKKKTEVIELINSWYEKTSTEEDVFEDQEVDFEDQEDVFEDQSTISDQSRIAQAVAILNRVSSLSLREELEPIIYDLENISYSNEHSDNEEERQETEYEAKVRKLIEKRAKLGL